MASQLVGQLFPDGRRSTFTYDAANNRTGSVELSGRTTTWTYDAAYQLTREERSGAGGYDVGYQYDAVGNRLVQNDGGQLTTSTYDAANQLVTETALAGVTSYLYDADGNRSRKESPTALTLYDWDEDNRLITAQPPAGARKRWQAPLTGTARRVLRINGACHLFRARATSTSNTTPWASGSRKRCSRRAKRASSSTT